MLIIVNEKAGRHGEKAGRKCYLAKVDSRYASGDLLWEILAASHMGKAHTEAWVLGFMDWGGKKMVCSTIRLHLVQRC